MLKLNVREGDLVKCMKIGPYFKSLVRITDVLQVTNSFYAKTSDGINIHLKPEEFEEVVQPLQESCNPLEAQVGGSHYKDMKIQPVTFIMENNLNFLQGNAIKYISRYKNKNGKADLEKAIHCLQLLITLEYK